MDEEHFWRIIQTAKDNAHGSYEVMQEDFANELRKLTSEQIVTFGNRFRYFREQANTWKLWGAKCLYHSPAAQVGSLNKLLP